MYKNVIFDLYGTLIDLASNEEKDMLWQNLSLFYSYNGAKYSDEELRKSYLEFAKQEIDKIRNTNYPDIKIEKIFRRLYSEKNIEVNECLIEATAKFFRISSTNYIKLYDGVLEMLIALKKSGKKIFLLSNAQRVFTIPEMEYLDILKYFDGVYISSDYEISKPDKRFMEVLLEKELIRIEESIMVGNDHTTDIEIANRVNMDSLYIHTEYSKKVLEERNGKLIEKVSIGATYKVLDGDIRKMMGFLL